MKLIVDTIVVFSLFKSDSFRRQLLSEHNFELFAPKFALEELFKYKEELIDKSGFNSFDAVSSSSKKQVPPHPKGCGLRQALVFRRQKKSDS
jgi:predicted nucleic acid-binding protein